MATAIKLTNARTLKARREGILCGTYKQPSLRLAHPPVPWRQKGLNDNKAK